MIKFIYLFLSIFYLGIIYYEAKGAAKANKNIILGVMLPPLELENEEVLKISKNFLKETVKLFILEFFLCIPCVFVKTVYQIIYWLVWFLISYYFYYKLIAKYNNQLKELKRKNDWLLPNKHIVNIDTELSRISDKMPISICWFIISFIIGMSPLVIELIVRSGYKSNLIISIGTSLITNIIFLILFKIYALGRSVVYSEDSKVNIVCNKVYKRTWSIIYVIGAIITSIINNLIYISAIINKYDNLLFILILVPSVFLIAAIILGKNYIDKVQNRILKNVDNAIYVDSDEYWINGVFYRNPYDNRVTVEPRIGYKAVYNLGTKKGRMIQYGSCIFAALIVTVVVGILLMFENMRYSIVVTKNTVEINAPIYATEIAKEDINELALVDKLNVTYKSNGIATEDYCIGEFKVEEYGKCKLYINNDVDTYILTKTDEGYIFYNLDTEQDTVELYNKINK